MYGFLIQTKTSGNSSMAPTYKRYTIEGEKTPFETDDLTELANMYETLLSEYPKDRVFPFHFLNVALNTSIAE